MGRIVAGSLLLFSHEAGPAHAIDSFDVFGSERRQTKHNIPWLYLGF
jgi:hypothetical protein